MSNLDYIIDYNFHYSELKLMKTKTINIWNEIKDTKTT